jgi:hypothetical protein
MQAVQRETIGLAPQQIPTIMIIKRRSHCTLEGCPVPILDHNRLPTDADANMIRPAWFALVTRSTPAGESLGPSRRID